MIPKGPWTYTERGTINALDGQPVASNVTRSNGEALAALPEALVALSQLLEDETNTGARLRAKEILMRALDVGSTRAARERIKGLL